MAISGPLRTRSGERFFGIAVRVVVALLATLVAVAAITVYFDRKRDREATPAVRLERGLLKKINENPSDPALRVQLATAYLETRRFDDAIRTANEAVKLKRDYPRAYLVLGLAWLNKRDWANAERSFGQVVELLRGSEMAGQNPNLEQAYFYLGIANHRQKEYDKALQFLKMALSINRASADTLYFIGDIYLKRKAPDLAVQTLEDAVAYDPKFVDAQYTLGQAYEQLKRRTLAAEHYRLAWEASNSRFAPAKAALDRFGTPYEHLLAGKKALAAGKLDAGVRELELSMALDPNSANAAFALGQAYEKQAGRAKGAKERLLRLQLAYGMYLKVKELVSNYPGLSAALKRTVTKSSAKSSSAKSTD